MIRHAWLQKHPSPAKQGGEFHWYPEVGDRELRASFVERVRGLEPPAVLWQLEPGRAAWAQVFSATAPTDGRRYVGLVLSVATGDAPLAELLASIAPPAAEPWTEAADDARAADAAAVRDAPGESSRDARAVDAAAAGREASLRDGRDASSRDARALDSGVDVAPGHGASAIGDLSPSREVRAARRDTAAIARALLTGGSAAVDDIGGRDLPQRVAAIERIMPARAPVDGADRVAELAAAAWREPTSRAGRAWRLLCELAVGEPGTSPVDLVARKLEPFDPQCVLTEGERAEVREAANVVDVLHAWSRGRLDRSPDAATLPVRLANLVALRVLARLAADQDEHAAIAEARWYALLSAARRKALLGAIAQRTRSLRALVEVTHA